MSNSKNSAAGETAKRTMVIFRDCHVSNNIVVPIEDAREERFYRNYARRMGWPCTIRRATAEAVARRARAAEHNWRKPLGLPAAERPRLGGAFGLELTELMREGGER